MSDAAPIMLTGASGFLGTEIARRCVTRGLLVRCTGRSAAAEVPNYQPADLTNAADVARVISSSRTLIHCAGLAHQFTPVPAERFHSVNVQGTRNVIEAAIAAGTQQVVLVSSVSVYGGAADDIVDEDTLCHPQSPYAQSKLEAEAVAAELTEPAGIPLTILRMATIYGEGDPGNVAKLVRAIDRRRFFWIGGGRNLKSLIHVQDAAEACVIAALAKPPAGTHTYNVAADPCRMRQIVDCISDALGRSVLPLQIPVSVPLCVAGVAGSLLSAEDSFPNRVGRTLRKWVANDAFDGRRFRQDFGFAPKVTLSDGIRREADWYRRRAA